jgi:2-methylisocitrate lyase-like PEP mutase family enzyme
MNTQAQKAIQFQQLHSSGTFVIPNFWDVGSAVTLEQCGFKALASTSAGFAQAIGKPDGQVTLEEKLRHLQEVCAATTVPVSADFEHGFADAPKACAENLLRAAETGIVGASIEDWSRTQIYDFELAKDRIAACKEAIETLDFPFTLTARAENLLRGVGSLDDTIERLKAYEKAGAHVLFAPGLSNSDDVRSVLTAVNSPLNVLFAFMPNSSVADYEALGVRRVSLGHMLALYMSRVTGRVADSILKDGRFDWVADGTL